MWASLLELFWVDTNVSEKVRRGFRYIICSVSKPIPSHSTKIQQIEALENVQKLIVLSFLLSRGHNSTYLYKIITIEIGNFERVKPILELLLVLFF